VSVVVPVFRGEATVEELHRRIVETLAAAGHAFQIVLVEDCGGDSAWEKIRALAFADPRVTAVRMSRNFGQHLAITAGLAAARGDWIVVMDCDLQDPPEEIPRFLEAALSASADVVYGLRRPVAVPLLRGAANRLYFRLLSAATGSPIDHRAGSFSVVSRKVAAQFLRIGDIERHYLLGLRWLGFRSTTIEYDRPARAHGTSTYTMARLLRHALGGLFFQTTRILHGVVYGGMIVSIVGALLAAYFAVQTVRGSPPPGWTSLVVLVLVLGGATIFSIGVVGLYVGRIFEQVRGRPAYVVDATIDRGVESS
jgi:dolichol-phosphate mannosyltransferase